MDCVKHLDICKAECCKCLVFTLPSTTSAETVLKLKELTVRLHPFTLEQKKYYNYHAGVKVIYKNRVPYVVIQNTGNIEILSSDEKGLVILVHAICNQLDENNLCKQHAQGIKLKMCANLDEDNQEGYYITPNCLLKKN